MRIIYRFKNTDIFCFCVALCIIIMMKPYFVWSSFSNAFKILANLFVVIVVAYEYLHIFKIGRIENEQAILTLMILIYMVYRIINSASFSITYHLKVSFVIFQLIAFILLTEEERFKVFEYFKNIFCFIILMGLLTYPFAMLNVRIMGLGGNLYSESEVWAEGGFYYKNYILAIYTANDSMPWYVGRFCALFNEPGLVGTFSALILIADQAKLSKRKNTIILLGGLLSFSFAFYILLFLYLLFSGGIFEALKTSKGRKVFSFFTFLLIIVMIVVLSNSSFYNKLNDLLFSRVRGLIAGQDNRTTSAFDDLYSDFLSNGSISEHIFGHGFGTIVKNESTTNTSSYKTQVYDLGYFGLFYLYVICAYAALSLNRTGKNKSKWILLGLFIISTYQRIGVLDVAYFSILICGGKEACSQEKGNKINYLILE